MKSCNWNGAAKVVETEQQASCPAYANQKRRGMPGNRNRHASYYSVSRTLLAMASILGLGRLTEAFVPTVPHSHWHQERSSLKEQSTLLPGLTITTASTSLLASQSDPFDIFCINWEGCLVETVDWRIETGMKVACDLWPHCSDLLEQTRTAEEQADAQSFWLSNKLAACQHVLQETRDMSVAGAYALATRMFLEEQELDQGRSTGRGGKYGSLFHPQTDSGNANRRTQNGSRPLTVGEVIANWCDGAVLCETLPAKYKCPPDKLQQAVDKQQPMADIAGGIKVYEDVADTLAQTANDSTKRMLVTVSHAVDLAAAEERLRDTFESLACKVVVASDVNHALQSDDAAIVLLAKSRFTIGEILEDASSNEKDCIVHVVESSWRALEQEVPLFEDIPRSGVGETKWGSRLALVVADWAQPRTDTLQRAAVMSPWTTLLSQEDLEGRLTARIVPR